MATPKKDPSEHQTRGPKKRLPDGARNRTLRCDAGEYAALVSYLDALRVIRAKHAKSQAK